MARIRSIHPAIWTDEDFAMLSMGARVLFFGIWTDSDDHGVFQWKPVSLKMRIFPADKVDVEPFLEELITFNKVMKFTNKGGVYGVVRNFCRFQRPKKPNYKFFIPDELLPYVGLTEASTEPVPHQYGTGTEDCSLMKEEGGRRKEGEEKKQDKNVADATPLSGRYAFENGVIRLNKKDFEKWKAAFSHLDLQAELVGMSQWAAKQDNWFNAVAGLLAKKNGAIHERIEQAKNAPNGREKPVPDNELWDRGL